LFCFEKPAHFYISQNREENSITTLKYIDEEGLSHETITFPVPWPLKYIFGYFIATLKREITLNAKANLPE